MTIGIAAFGQSAGLAVWKALQAAEMVGSGAVAGFASLVVIGGDGRLHRTETQIGGAVGLFAGGEVPTLFASARHAALMSSGPNRPEPLSQFTPADPAVGLITGHRLPNTLGASGVALNSEVLELMREGRSPEDAVHQVVTANPTIDAGLIALSIDGRIHAGDTAHVRQFGDAGAATLGSRDSGAIVSVLHNAIRPYRALALLVAETALNVMAPPDRADGHIVLKAGIPVIAGEQNFLTVNAAGEAVAFTVADAKYTKGYFGLGLGYQVEIVRAGTLLGQALYEPYMVVIDGRLASMDGAAKMKLPIRVARKAQ